jgi:hypothetical protein
MFLKSRQSPDGQWIYPIADARPPICSDYIAQTAVSMRALQLYAPKADKPAYDHAIDLAAAWLAKARSTTNEDRIARVLGLAWAGKDKDATQIAVRELLATQRADGGWSDLDSLESSAYTTGRSLVALQSAQLPAGRPGLPARRQVSAEHATGRWILVRQDACHGVAAVLRRRLPYGFDQWISAAGTNWATVALSQAFPATTAMASPGR